MKGKHRRSLSRSVEQQQQQSDGMVELSAGKSNGTQRRKRTDSSPSRPSSRSNKSPLSTGSMESKSKHKINKQKRTQQVDGTNSAATFKLNSYTNNASSNSSVCSTIGDAMIDPYEFAVKTDEDSDLLSSSISVSQRKKLKLDNGEDASLSDSNRCSPHPPLLVCNQPSPDTNSPQSIRNGCSRPFRVISDLSAPSSSPHLQSDHNLIDLECPSPASHPDSTNVHSPNNMGPESSPPPPLDRSLKPTQSHRKSSIPSNQQVLRNKHSVGMNTILNNCKGTMTEPDLLGPCEPGTTICLNGIVWLETTTGVLVVNVTWRGRTYIGTLLDATQHDFAPPCPRDYVPPFKNSFRSSNRNKRRNGLNNQYKYQGSNGIDSNGKFVPTTHRHRLRGRPSHFSSTTTDSTDLVTEESPGVLTKTQTSNLPPEGGQIETNVSAGYDEEALQCSISQSLRNEKSADVIDSTSDNSSVTRKTPTDSLNCSKSPESITNITASTEPVSDSKSCEQEMDQTFPVTCPMKGCEKRFVNKTALTFHLNHTRHEKPPTHPTEHNEIPPESSTNTSESTTRPPSNRSASSCQLDEKPLTVELLDENSKPQIGYSPTQDHHQQPDVPIKSNDGSRLGNLSTNHTFCVTQDVRSSNNNNSNSTIYRTVTAHTVSIPHGPMDKMEMSNINEHSKNGTNKARVTSVSRSETANKHRNQHFKSSIHGSKIDNPNYNKNPGSNRLASYSHYPTQNSPPFFPTSISALPKPRSEYHHPHHSFTDLNGGGTPTITNNLEFISHDHVTNNDPSNMPLTKTVWNVRNSSTSITTDIHPPLRSTPSSSSTQDIRPPYDLSARILPNLFSSPGLIPPHALSKSTCTVPPHSEQNHLSPFSGSIDLSRPTLIRNNHPPNYPALPDLFIAAAMNAIHGNTLPNANEGTSRYYSVASKAPPISLAVPCPVKPLIPQSLHSCEPNQSNFPTIPLSSLPGANGVVPHPQSISNNLDLAFLNGSSQANTNPDRLDFIKFTNAFLSQQAATATNGSHFPYGFGS